MREDAAQPTRAEHGDLLARALSFGPELAPLYAGGAPFAAGARTLHVCALVCDAGELHTMQIDARAPTSPLDALALELTRVYADAILISGRILREEGTLDYRLVGPRGAALAALRRARVGHAQLRVAVASRSGPPPTHPIFDGAAVELLLPPTRADELRARFDTLAGVHACAAENLAELLGCTRAGLGVERVSLEIGPSSTHAAYHAPEARAAVAIDELFVSLLAPAPATPEFGRVGPSFAAAAIEASLPWASAAVEVEGPRGRWAFQRRRRLPLPGMTRARLPSLGTAAR